MDLCCASRYPINALRDCDTFWDHRLPSSTITFFLSPTQFWVGKKLSKIMPINEVRLGTRNTSSRASVSAPGARNRYAHSSACSNGRIDYDGRYARVVLVGLDFRLFESSRRGESMAACNFAVSLFFQ